MVHNSLIFYLIIIILTTFKVYSNEVEINSSRMKITKEGNIIASSDSEIIIPSENIYIKSNQATYEKNLNTVILTKDVFFNDKNNQIIIESDFVKYEKDKDLIYSDGKTQINIEGKYNINSNNIYYDRFSKKIFSNKETLIEDIESNLYILKDGFKFNFKDEIIKSKSSIILDKNNNKYIFENLIINLKNNEIAGKEIKVEFDKSYFGNEQNEPLLKGRSSYSNKKELKVYKAVFSTCNIQNKKCRGWELNADEFVHNKQKKIFEYKNSWLKIFDKKVFFTPYFNHPDPTVKRKSGFLTPSYATSESLGFSVNIPYFKVLGRDKDITFNPRYYADKSFLLQNEYRQALKNSNILTDFSLLVGEAGTKGHFFYNQVGKLNENLNFKLNLQSVDGDNYLKNHNLLGTSDLIINDNLLLSNLDLNWDFKDSNLNTSVKIFEDLSRNYNDRYQYIFPDFKFSKNLEIPESYNGKFNFNSYGYNKHFDTNVIETSITNDFLFSSNENINSSGVISNYYILLKNSNSYADNSPNFDDNTNYNLFGTLKFDARLPLQKSYDKYNHFLTPVVSIMHSPNGNNDISSKDLTLNYNNVFNLNRISATDQVEGGESLSLGLEFKRSDLNGSDILNFRIANVIKADENANLPTKSKLNKTRSDIFGDINYNISDNIQLSYIFSYDRDLKYSNLEQINFGYSLNNFLTNLSYLTEDNDLDSKENLKNYSSLNLNDENKVSFEFAKDLKDDFTQYYDLIYAYQTDCISINLNYNKSFFRDGNLKPNESIAFLIKIIPFTEIGVPNFGELISK